MSGSRETHLRILRSVADVTQKQWNALLTPTDAPVLRHEWILAMEASGSAVPERGWVPKHLTLWRGDTLVAACPAYEKHHSMGEYIYDFGWANVAAQLGIGYYPKLLVGLPLSPLTARRFLVAPGENETVCRKRLIEALIDLAQEQNYSSIHVLFLEDREAEAFDDPHFGFFRRSTLQFHWRNPGYDSWGQFLTRFDAKRRHQMKRERAAAHSQGLTLSTIRSSEIDSSHAELAWRFYQATASRYSWGPVQLTRSFFLKAFAAMPDAIELVVARRSDGEVVAGAFNLHTNDRLYGRYWGCFKEYPFLHFHVCLYHSVEDAIHRGLKVFEPGAGGEHKVSRGFEPTVVHSAHRVFDRRLESILVRAAGEEQARVEEVASSSQEVSGLKPWHASGR